MRCHHAVEDIASEFEYVPHPPAALPKKHVDCALFRSLKQLHASLHATCISSHAATCIYLACNSHALRFAVEAHIASKSEPTHPPLTHRSVTPPHSMRLVHYCVNFGGCKLRVARSTQFARRRSCDCRNDPSRKVRDPASRAAQGFIQQRAVVLS